MIAVEQQLRSSLTDVRELTHCYREEVTCERKRLAVKVSGRVGEAPRPTIALGPVLLKLQVDRLRLFAEKEWIVGRRVQFPFCDRPDLGDRIA